MAEKRDSSLATRPRRVEPRIGSRDSAVPPARRRGVRSASARSRLLTILGEFAFPQPAPMWTATLIESMTCLGIAEKSARQALTRTASEGVLESQRSGRRVLWSLTDSGRALLEEGTARIYGFMRSGRPWDGRWLTVSVPVPESQRRLRHRLHTRLTWLGLGSPTPGLWVGTDATRTAEVHAVIRSLDLDDHAFAWVGPAAGIGDESWLISQAWDLDDVEDLYLEFIDTFEQRRVRSNQDAFAAQVDMIEAWRRFPFLDPALPAELLDHDWPGPRAAAAFHERHARWNLDARAAWASFVKAGGPLP